MSLPEPMDIIVGLSLLGGAAVGPLLTVATILEGMEALPALLFIPVTPIVTTMFGLWVGLVMFLIEEYIIQ